MYSGENFAYLEAAMNPTFCRTESSLDLYLDLQGTLEDLRMSGE